MDHPITPLATAKRFSCSSWLGIGLVCVAVVAGLSAAGCGEPGARSASAGAEKPSDEFQPEILPLPANPSDYAPIEKWAAMTIPADNPMTAEKAALGRQLYFDKRLSGDGKFACYSCHVNEHGLTDGKALNVGPFDKKLTRSSPTMWNIGYQPEWYWDGRAKTLEAQALAAWKGANMGATNPDEIVAKLNKIPGYVKQFRGVYNQDATPENVAKSLAAYMRTIISKDTNWDRFQRGDKSAVSEAAVRGHQVFEQAKCINCHAGYHLTSWQYYNVGIGMKAEKPDLGRFNVTKEEKDKGAFKAPTLRDVARSAPYFHDGSVPTLEEAVRLMVNGGIDNPHLDRVNLQKQNLTDAQIKDLVEFLKSLSENTRLVAPRLPPE